MTNEVTTTANEISVSMDAFGAAPVSSSDVVIPRLRQMQSMSKEVTDGDRKLGDIVDTSAGEVVADFKTTFDFLPFHLHKVWLRTVHNGSRYAYDKDDSNCCIEDVTPANENRSWEVTIDGKQYKNEKIFQFYGVRPEDMSIPYIVSYKSTSMKAGRELVTQMYIKNRAAGLTPCGKVISIGSTKVSNTKGTYAVMANKVGRNATNEEVMKCLEWFKAVQSGEAKASANEETQSTKSEPSQPEVTPEF